MKFQNMLLIVLSMLLLPATSFAHPRPFHHVHQKKVVVKKQPKIVVKKTTLYFGGGGGGRGVVCGGVPSIFEAQ